MKSWDPLGVGNCLKFLFGFGFLIRFPWCEKKGLSLVWKERIFLGLKGKDFPYM